MSIKPAKIVLAERGFLLAINNIWRNKLLSLATIFVIGIIIFIFNIILAINVIAQDALTDLSKKIDIIVYLKDSTNESQANDIMADLQKMEGVENVTYTSKEDALQKIKTTHPDLSLAFEKYRLGNPLPASINITTIHPKYHQGIAETLAKEKYQSYLSNVITNSDDNTSIIGSVSKNLLAVTGFTNQIVFWLISIFVVGGSLIILNALQITIFSRKKEIEIMKLVGSSYWFIRLPFIIESVIYGLLAVLSSFILLALITQNVSIGETSLWNYFDNVSLIKIFLIEILVTVFLSVLSSMIAVHEHLFRKS